MTYIQQAGMTDYLNRQIDIEDPQFAAVFDEATFWASRFGALMLDEIELRDHIKGLDVGCGAGFPLIELANMHGPSCHFTGVDIWKAALERARAKAEFQRLTNVTLLEADAAKLPLPNSSFDLITSNLGLNNFETPEAVLADCHRVAKSKARLVLTTNIRGHMKEFYEVFGKLLRDLGKEEELELLEKNEAHRGTVPGLEMLLQRTGFTVVRAVERAFPLRFLNGSALLRHNLCYWFLGGWRSAVTTEEENEIFAILEKRLNEKAAREGELRTTIPALYLEAVRR